jgi:hypothetical protein
VPQTVELHFDKIESLLNGVRRQVPVNVGVLGQELSEVEGQLAFVTDDGGLFQ